jgi:hypothetical protein
VKRRAARAEREEPTVTLFAIPKPFEGEAAVIQRNALESWARLGREVEVVLLGDDKGVAEAVSAVGARHLGPVETTEYGTPLLSSAFEVARRGSTRRLLAYVNADIILLRDFVDAVRRIDFSTFLAAGRRWNVSLGRPFDFGPGYEERLRALVRTGELAAPDAIDYFVFDREGPLTELPPFVVGRPGWDNWMIYQARRLGIPVVDATRAITAIHPRHGYEHVPEGTGARWSGPEAEANFELIKGLERFQTRHATHVLTRRFLLPGLAPRRVLSRVRSRHAVDGSVEKVARLTESLAARLPGRRTGSRER